MPCGLFRSSRSDTSLLPFALCLLPFAFLFLGLPSVVRRWEGIQRAKLQPLPHDQRIHNMVGARRCRRPTPDPGWKWSLERVLETVNHVRAGRSLQPAAGWPNGARVAALLSFDVDNETSALRTGQPTIGALAQGEYGARVGMGRILALLDRYAIPASFFIPAVSLLLSPAMRDAICRSGRHEIGVHGWIHETNSSLPLEEERELMARSIETLTQLCGERPVGYRAPSWNFSPNTLDLLREFGFLYDSSLMADDRPYELLADGKPTGIVELPVEWILDDAPLLDPRGDRYSPPRELLQVFMDEFDRAYEEGTLFVLTMHPHHIGHRSRMVILEKLISPHALEAQRLVCHPPRSGRIREVPLDVTTLITGRGPAHLLPHAARDGAGGGWGELLLDAGETLAIVGESGCGKSMTALSILQLVPEPAGYIESGRILFDGRDLLDYTVDEMRAIRGKEIAMIFQEPMTS